jgi:peptidoglycan/LPS O-acetylase OafA/YrhL
VIGDGAHVEDKRYQLLDAWRGIAALSVLGYHTIDRLVEPGAGRITDLILSGWAGVYIFFPISGYCILAASHAPSGSSALRFVQRRWRRIFPTYWASIAFVVALTALHSPSGALSLVAAPGIKWLSIATLTQTFAGISGAIDPAYWSLCYEEQFYLILAVALLARPAARPALLLSVSVCAAVLCCFHALEALPKGLFIDQWLNFAVGLAAFGWFDARYGRRWSAAIFALGLTTGAITGDPSYFISSGAAAVFVALRRYDARISTWRFIRALSAVGLISYSLYLIHVPITMRVINTARRLASQPAAIWPAVTLVGAVLSLGCALTFHHFVERPFQNRASRSTHRRAGVHATPAMA